MVPSLLLQPVVEGLVREVVAPAQGHAEIVVAGRRSGDLLLVRLTGSRFDAGPEPDMTQRIEAVRSRLALLHGAKAAVESTVAVGGVSIEIRLPWRPETAAVADS